MRDKKPLILAILYREKQHYIDHKNCTINYASKTITHVTVLEAVGCFVLFLVLSGSADTYRIASYRIFV